MRIHRPPQIAQTPNETFKAAAHLVVTGTKRRYRDVQIVLAHLGGSTPFLAARVAVLSGHMGCTLSCEEILEDFGSFYYETALSACESNLAAMERFVAPDRILFGTDFPGPRASRFARTCTDIMIAFDASSSDPRDGRVVYEESRGVLR